MIVSGLSLTSIKEETFPVIFYFFLRWGGGITFLLNMACSEFNFSPIGISSFY